MVVTTYWLFGYVVTTMTCRCPAVTRAIAGPGAADVTAVMLISGR
jgi:hypothetical protein